MRPTSVRSSFEMYSATFLGEGQIDFFILQKAGPPGGVCIACSPSASLTESTKEDEQQTEGDLQECGTRGVSD